MKARIEVIGDFENLKAISEVLKQRSNKSNAASNSARVDNPTLTWYDSFSWAVSLTEERWPLI